VGRAAKIAVAVILGALVVTLAIMSTLSPRAPRETRMSGASAGMATPGIPARCRAITARDPDCEAAWGAERRRFFKRKD
jgi:conjugative transfer region protein TrbK